MSKFDFRKRIDKILNAVIFFGIWRKNEPGSFGLALIFFMALGINVLTVLETIGTYLIREDPGMLTLNVLMVATDFFGNVKIYFLLKYRRNIVSLREAVNRKSFQPKNSKQQEMTENTFGALNVMYRIYMFGPILTISTFGVLPFLQATEEKRLPFLAWYPFDYKKNYFLYSLIFFHQMLAQMWTSQMYVHADCLSFTFLAVVIAQLDILTDDLKNLFQSKRAEGAEVKESLRQCIIHHKEILTFAEEVFKMLNMGVFGQFVMSTGSLCCLLLQMSLAKMDAQFIAIIFYVGTFSGELFLYCWWGNRVMDKSEKLPYAAFESSWMDTGTKTKRDVLFVILRTQKSLTVYALNFFTVNLQSFLMILRLSYSYYTVIRNTNNK